MLFRSTDPNIADSITQKGFGIVNARIHWRDPLGHEGITASIFARNLFDKIYGTSATALNNALGVTSKQFGEPRICGASLAFTYSAAHASQTWRGGRWRPAIDRSGKRPGDTMSAAPGSDTITREE